MILCVTANAAVDKTAIISPFRLNAIHRPQQLIALPGGKGCNVARGLKTLGASAVVAGWVGGGAGQFIETGLHREGIETAFVHVEAESRTCLSILDRENGTLTEVYERGEPIAEDKLTELLALFERLVPNYRAAALSGSLPGGVPPDFYARLIVSAHAADVPVYLDTSGEPLRLALPARPFLIKPNSDEFAALTGQSLSDPAALAQAALAVSAQYGVNIILSLGADGAIAVCEGEAMHARPESIEIVSAVGSGDCMLAGVMYGLTRKFSMEIALRYGIAAGTANALRLGAGLFTLEDFNRILPTITVTRY
jgi:tagatose 6-phosphate kinase